MDLTSSILYINSLVVHDWAGDERRSLNEGFSMVLPALFGKATWPSLAYTDSVVSLYGQFTHDMDGVSLCVALLHDYANR